MLLFDLDAVDPNGVVIFEQNALNKLSACVCVYCVCITCFEYSVFEMDCKLIGTSFDNISVYVSIDEISIIINFSMHSSTK